jgi:hypothetical protein
MICLEVHRNNERLCTAGAATGGFNADVMWNSPPDRSGDAFISFYVGGVIGEDSVEWVRDSLSVGDLVSFRVVESPEADPPRPGAPDDPEWIAASALEVARDQHAELTRRLNALEEKWGPRLKQRDA